MIRVLRSTTLAMTDTRRKIREAEYAAEERLKERESLFAQVRLHCCYTVLADKQRVRM
jgi:hypothetical protein